MRSVTVWLLLSGLAVLGSAQTPPSPTTPLPPPGRVLTDELRSGLHDRVRAMEGEIDSLRRELAAHAERSSLLPDVEVLWKAVAWSLLDDTFYAEKEVAYAHRLLELAHQRAADLRTGRAPWLAETGLVLRGHRSRLDGSVQPYALIVPSTATAVPRPALVWLLGRNERRTELAFFAEREASPPPFQPQDAVVLIPYGRYCNATKFAGEVDVLEALAAVRAERAIDPLRIAVGGFSMGGGSTWHLAVHHPGLWCAATPGAGFAETPAYTRALAPGKEPRPVWEQTLWRWYDATGYAGNLFQVPTHAYAGELDPQRQAGEIMAGAMVAAGLSLPIQIGPNTAHVYEAGSKSLLARWLDERLAAGRTATPAEIRFTTYTLRYATCAWLRVEGLVRHWERGEVRATQSPDGVVTLTTSGITALSLTGLRVQRLEADGQSVPLAQPGADRPVRLAREDGRWREAPEPAGLAKRPGLTGPVNDAFMEPFLYVRPSGRPLHPKVGTWVESELSAAASLWRRLGRARVPVRLDTAVTDQDLAEKNLVLWGDPSSNALLARLLPQLPLTWTKDRLEVRGRVYDAAHHAPVLIIPNPLNPRRYVVLNSGYDVRGDGFASNALQTPKFPDWAVIDLREPASARWPGKVVDAGFFDEAWR
jgi:hypothetical protein